MTEDHGLPERLPAVAVVLTHRRPRLATETVRMLVDGEGLSPQQVILVVNGDGGLTDRGLEAAIDVVQLPTNLGPAGGFRAGLQHARERSGVNWIYICEDDVCLLDLPVPRIADLIGRIEHHVAAGRPKVGAVVAYGRDLDGRSGRSVPHVPGAGDDFEPVDVAAWGATLVSRDLLDEDVLPDERFFFGFEDFDFFLAVQRAGFGLFADPVTARRVQDEISAEGLSLAFEGERPVDSEQPWRHYYLARNFVELQRRYGRASWAISHLGFSLRRCQLSRSPRVGVAIVRGLIDGYRGRLGAHAMYLRDIGEVEQR